MRVGIVFFLIKTRNFSPGHSLKRTIQRVEIFKENHSHFRYIIRCVEIKPVLVPLFFDAPYALKVWILVYLLLKLNDLFPDRIQVGFEIYHSQKVTR